MKNMEYGKRKFNVFHKFTGYVLILLTACFLQYAQALSVQELMTQVKLTEQEATLIKDFFEKRKTPLNIINYDKGSGKLTPQHYWQEFSEEYEKIFVAPEKDRIFEKYKKSPTSTDGTLSFLKLGRVIN